MQQENYMELDGNSRIPFDYGTAIMTQKGGWSIGELFRETYPGLTKKSAVFTTHKLGVKGSLKRTEIYEDR